MCNSAPRDGLGQISGDPLVHAILTVGVVAVAHLGLNIAGLHRVAAFRTVTVQIWKSIAAWSAAFAVMALLNLTAFAGGAFGLLCVIRLALGGA